MSSKVMSVLGAVILGVAILAGTTQGCGGGSSGANITELCTRGCQKTLSCLPAGVPAPSAADCQTTCETRAMGSNGQRCTNESALVAKYNECIGKADCTMFLSCLQTIPACQGATTGAGGTTGTAGTGTTGTAGRNGTAGTGSTGAAGFSFDGSIPNFDGSIPAFDANFGFDLGGFTGAGGSAGTTCGTACVKADQCCAALGSTNCTFATSCNAGTATVQSCNAVLQLANASGAAPAACK